MTPAVVDKPGPSNPLSMSIDMDFGRCECRDDLDPAALLPPLGGSGYSPPSS